jgi:hypothetical protein
MVTGIRPSNYAPQSGHPTSPGSGNVPALEGRIQQARVQLNDWASCVSARTPKGQAEIQKFSGEISADKQKIARAQQSQANISAAVAQVSAAATSGRGKLVDVWA